MLTLYYQTEIGIPNSIPYHLRNKETARFLSVRPYFITEICKYLRIEYTEVTKETWKNEPAFYHIEIDWIDPAMIYQNIFYWIDKDVLDNIKNSDKNLKLLLWFPNEGFSLEMPRFIDIIDFCLKDLMIPAEKVYFVFGDINIEKNYKLWKSKLGLENIKVFGFDSFEASYHNECRMIAASECKNSFITDEQYNNSIFQNRKKRFIFKNANPRPHRLYFASELFKKNLLKDSYFSWLNRYYSPSASLNVIKKFNLKTEDESELLLKMQELLDSAPYILDFDSKSINEWLNQRLLIPDHFLNSYFTFVTETTFEDCIEENVLFVTEKVYQPIIQYHPFIVAAGVGFLDHMRNYGYQTFPELFDESYDSENNLKLRTKKILENIERICNMPIEQLNEIYYDSNFQKKLIHNRELFLTHRGKKKWEEAINWLITN
jgi:hypothetical protein